MLTEWKSLRRVKENSEKWFESKLQGINVNQGTLGRDT